MPYCPLMFHLQVQSLNRTAIDPQGVKTGFSSEGV